jgi:serine/threonine protein kinase
MEGTRHVDHRADIYSLGVVIYEMLTGELPLGRFALPSQKVQVDVRLDDIVLKTLEKEPDRRYQHASDAVQSQVPRPQGVDRDQHDVARAWFVMAAGPRAKDQRERQGGEPMGSAHVESVGIAQVPVS